MAFQRRVLVCEAQQDWGSLRGLRHNQVNTTKAAKQSFGSKQAIETSKVGRLQKAILGEGKIHPSDACVWQSHATSGHRSTSTGPTPIPPWRNSGRGLQGAEGKFVCAGKPLFGPRCFLGIFQRLWIQERLPDMAPEQPEQAFFCVTQAFVPQPWVHLFRISGNTTLCLFHPLGFPWARVCQLSLRQDGLELRRRDACAQRQHLEDQDGCGSK